jgi:hypothetical protein
MDKKHLALQLLVLIKEPFQVEHRLDQLVCEERAELTAKPVISSRQAHRGKGE